MTKRLIATVLSAALVLTGVSTAPARADGGEFARFMLGAGALLFLGHAITNSNRNNGPRVMRREVVPTHRVAPTRRHVVPSACLRVNQSGHGPRQYLGQRCLNQNMRHVGRLPNSCLRSIWTNRGQRSVYGAHCLRQNGWVFG